MPATTYFLGYINTTDKDMNPDMLIRMHEKPANDLDGMILNIIQSAWTLYVLKSK